MNDVRSQARLNVRWALVVALSTCVLLALFPELAHASKLLDVNGLGPVDGIVQKLWALEQRAIEQGQLAAGVLFGGLATIHLMVIALQAVTRGEGLAHFQEQLLWTSAFGAAIGLGPTWARAIVDFFRNVGRSVNQHAVTPQKLLDLTIELFSGQSHGITEIVAASAYLVIVLLAGLIALVIFYQEAESHVILAAGAVVLGFGGAAATREMAIRYFRLALGSGLRLMLVEMINAAVMDTLVASVLQAKLEGGAGFETAGTLLVAMLVVLGFIIMLPIVVHSLSSGAISATAETLLAGLPAMAIAGGVAHGLRSSWASFMAAGRSGGRSTSERSGGGASSASDLSSGGATGAAAVGKRAGRGGATPGKEAVASAGSAGAGAPSAGAGSFGGSSVASTSGASAAADDGDVTSTPGSEATQAASASATSSTTASTSSTGSPSAAAAASPASRPSVGKGAQQPRKEASAGAPRPERQHAAPAATVGASEAASAPAGTARAESAPMPQSFWTGSSSTWEGSALGGSGGATSEENEPASSASSTEYRVSQTGTGRAGSGSTASPASTAVGSDSTDGPAYTAAGSGSTTSPASKAASRRSRIADAPTAVSASSAVDSAAPTSRSVQPSAGSPEPPRSVHSTVEERPSPSASQGTPAAKFRATRTTPSTEPLSVSSLLNPEGGPRR